MQFGHGLFSIGEIAGRTGLTPDALRYYERLGLLPRFQRTAGGFRIYTSDVVERVRFIKQAQMIGLSLDEIRHLVRELDHADPEHRSAATDLLATRLAEVDAKLSELREFRRTLKGYLRGPRTGRPRLATARSGRTGERPQAVRFEHELGGFGS